MLILRALAICVIVKTLARGGMHIQGRHGGKGDDGEEGTKQRRNAAALDETVGCNEGEKLQIEKKKNRLRV